MPFNLLEIGPAFVVGIAFYLSLYHFVLFFQMKRAQRVYLTYSIACIGIGLYDLSCLGKYSATNIIEGASWQRFNFFVGPIIVISLLWFFFDYTLYKKRKLGYILAMYFVATMVIGFAGPVELTLNIGLPMVKFIQVTPTLQIIYYDVGSGPLKIMNQACFLLSCVYCTWIALKNYNLGRKKESVPLFLVLIIFAAGLANDIAIVSGWYTSVYLVEYAYLAIVLLMANTLSTSVKAADRAKTDFLANMSHELRTPLNATLGFTEVLMEGLAGPVTPAQKEQLDIIYETNSNYLEIIDTLINVADIESCRSKHVFEGFSLKDLVQSCLDSFKEKAAGKSMVMKAEFNSNCSADMHADKDKIKQVLRNLLDNAIKFSSDDGECGIIVTKGNKECLITVWDSGIGISEEDQRKIFQPMHQIEPMLTKTHAGIGLGLYFSKKIVEFIGGKIWLESKLHAGTKVHFSIPMEKD